MCNVARLPVVSETMKTMVWIIVGVWVLVVVAFVVMVLRLARGESLDRAFSQALDKRIHRAAMRDREALDRLPRMAGGRLSFPPRMKDQDDEPGADGIISLACPVYVNSSSVVEMRALLTSATTGEIHIHLPSGRQIPVPWGGPGVSTAEFEPPAEGIPTAEGQGRVTAASEGDDIHKKGEALRDAPAPGGRLSLAADPGHGASSKEDQVDRAGIEDPKDGREPSEQAEPLAVTSEVLPAVAQAKGPSASAPAPK